MTYVINMPGMRKKPSALEKDVPRWKCLCDYPHRVMDMILERVEVEVTAGFGK